MLSWLSLRESKRFVNKHKRLDESFKTRWIRRVFNIIPNHYFSGGRVIYLSSCMQKGIVTLPFNYRNINVFGNLFGGSMYAGTDAMGMALVFLNIDWKNHIVIDRNSSMKYIRPGKTRLYASLEIHDELKRTINQTLADEGVYIYQCTIDITDFNGKLIAQINKEVHIENKERFKQRMGKRN